MDNLSPKLRQSLKKTDNFKDKIKQLGSALAGAGLLMGKSVVASVMSTVNAYQDVAQAQGEIASLGIDDSGIKAITKSAYEFSNQFAGTTTPYFIKASYDIKSGIASLSDTAVGEFTKTAALSEAEWFGDSSRRSG